MAVADREDLRGVGIESCGGPAEQLGESRQQVTEGIDPADRRADRAYTIRSEGDDSAELDSTPIPSRSRSITRAIAAVGSSSGRV